MKTKNIDMLSGSITKGLLALMMPIVIMNAVQNIFGIVDMMVLGNFVGDTAVGAVGACTMLINLCTSLLIGIAAGANIVIAKHVGEQNSLRTEKAVGTAMILAIVGSIVLAAIGILFAKPLLQLTKCPTALLDDAALYFRLYFLGVPFLMLYHFAAAILRAIGDTKHPMYFLLLASGIKMLLNFLFIRIFNMDVGGAGYATIVSNGSACVFCIIALRRSILQLRLRSMQFDIQEMKDILHLGIPTGLQNACYALANVAIITAVNGFGKDATTGISIANQIDGVLYYICCCPALAVAPYIAQNIGARNTNRVKKALSRSIGITAILGGGLGILFAVFSAELSSMMTNAASVIDFSSEKMIVACTTYFICGINEVLSSALRGLGKPVVPAVATLIFLCLLRLVWVYTVFPLCQNITFLYLVWPIGWMASCILLLAVYFPTVSKLQKQYAH